MITVTTKVRFTNGKAGRKRLDASAKPPLTIQVGRTPRISKLMALAIKFDGLLRDGVVADQSELARLARVTQPRMTQIMNLLSLAPDIQQELLFLPEVPSGRDPIHERMLRAVCAQPIWDLQRPSWEAIRFADAWGSTPEVPAGTKRGRARQVAGHIDSPPAGSKLSP